MNPKPGDQFVNANGSVLIAQEQYANEADLPTYLERACCAAKPGCGNVEVKLVIDFNPQTGAKQFGYRRDTGWNGYADGDFYYGPYDTADDLINAVNDDQVRWPWDEDELERRKAERQD